MTDLTKLTAKDLHDMLSTGLTSWTPPLYAVMREFVRRAEGYALACADRDSARDELAEMKALRDAAKSDHKEACRILRNYQTLAEERGREINALIRERDELHRRAQANDRLRSAAQAVLSWLNGEALEQYPSLAAEATHDVEPLRCNLETALAAAPAAQPTPAAPVTDAEIEAAITALTVDARREADALRVNPEASGTATEKRANRQVQLRALIARRVASAGAAPVDGDIIPLREAFDHLRTAYDALRAEINECHVFLATRGIAPERPLLERIKQCMRPAPVDSEREAKIGAVVRRLNACLDAKGCPECETGKSGSPTEAEETLVDEIIALMRSAPPAPAGDQDAKLREAIEALETVATKQQRVELRDAAHRILCGYSPCTNCGKWAHRSEGHWPCNPIAPVAAPAAPAGDQDAKLREVLAWVDANERRLGDCPVHIDGDDLRAQIRGLLAAPAGDDSHVDRCESCGSTARLSLSGDDVTLCRPCIAELGGGEAIASCKVCGNTGRVNDSECGDCAPSELWDEIRRLHRILSATAGDAKLRGLRERMASSAATKRKRVEDRLGSLVDRAAWIEVAESCEYWVREIDRLLAAPAASAIAAAPEAPSWTAKMIYATERMSDDAGYAHSECLNHVDINLMDVREFVFRLREQVESHARRIEALERANNKEAVK